MFIYKITNKVNGKIYIGQTIRPISKRFNRHMNDALNNIVDTHFARAIRKYGKENFYIECIDRAKNQEELTKKEQFWIRKYNSTNSKIGYNETDALYKCGGNTYKSKTEDELYSIKEKIKNTKLGSNNNNAKSVKCFNVETNEELIFQTIKECKIYFHEKHHRFITTRVAGDTMSLYKNVWKIAYLEDDYKNFTKKTEKRKLYIKIIDLDSNKEKIYTSMNQLYKDYDFKWNEIKGQIYNSDGSCKNEIYYEFFVRNKYKIQITILNQKCIDYS